MNVAARTAGDIAGAGKPGKGKPIQEGWIEDCLTAFPPFRSPPGAIHPIEANPVQQFGLEDRCPGLLFI